MALRRKDLLYGAHGALVLAYGLGRLVAARQAAGLDEAAGFAASALGRSMALAAMLIGVPALAAVAWLTFLERRDGIVLVLFALLVLAFAKRDGTDALDFAYVLAAAAAIGLRVVRRGGS